MKTKRSLQVLGFLALLLYPAQGRAVVADTGTDSTDTDTPSASILPDYNNVGLVNGDSGVYLGNGYVLTAAHVGLGDFMTEGVTYPAVAGSTITLTSSDGTAADVILFRLATVPLLPSVTIGSVSADPAHDFYITGFGRYRGAGSASSPDDPQDLGGGYSGFDWSASGAKSYGTNTLLGTGSAHDANGTNFDYFYSDFSDRSDTTRTLLEAQVASGDSGGGVFGFDADTGKYDLLIGINNALGYADGTTPPANTAFYGEYSLFADLGRYESQINADVPEPGEGWLVLGGFLVLIGSRFWWQKSPGG